MACNNLKTHALTLKFNQRLLFRISITKHFCLIYRKAFYKKLFDFSLLKFCHNLLVRILLFMSLLSFVLDEIFYGGKCYCLISIVLFAGNCVKYKPGYLS